MPSKQRLRNFCFTINNPLPTCVETMNALPTTYLIYGLEKGESGTQHYQGYCELDKQYSFKTVKTMLPKAHIEKRRGTSTQASDYCKKDGQFTEKGTISNPGKRNDIEHMLQMVKENKTTVELIETCPVPWTKYYKACDRARYEYAKQVTGFHPVTVTILIGDADSGKTRKAYEMDPNLYHWSPGSTLWFDGYTGQETILIDDYYGSIEYGKFLQLIDGYRFNLPIKGGFTWKAWKNVIITSNDQPRNWYEKGMTPALARRITKIINI